MPEPYAVDEVRDAAADDEPERDGQDRVPRARAAEEAEHPGDGEAGEHDHDRRRAREEAERDPRVLDVVDRERAEHPHLLVEREAARDDVLRELVGRDGCDRHRDQRDPLDRARGERPLGHGDRREPVGGGADADVDPARRGLAQARSPLRRQSMHCVAYGIASSRSSEIRCPQVSQIPNVPLAIRRSAPSIDLSTCSEFSSSE